MDIHIWNICYKDFPSNLFLILLTVLHTDFFFFLHTDVYKACTASLHAPWFTGLSQAFNLQCPGGQGI